MANTENNKSILAEYITEARSVFGCPEGAPYGFIVTRDNSNKKYGYGSLYYKIKDERKDYKMIEVIKDLRGGKKRLYSYDLGLIDEKNVYEWFEDLVNRQNNVAQLIKSPDGVSKFIQNGRFCNRKGKRSIQIQRLFKEGIGEIVDCILLTLTVHQDRVERVMPNNTNMNAMQYSTVSIGSWINVFLTRLRQYQKKRDMPWEFVGWTLEFQENGFPHVHMIFRGKWIGSIQEIAELWPYCEVQGVDYMNKAKYESKLRKEGKLKPGRHVSGIRLINYVTAYVSKCSKAYRSGHVHKGYAWLAFSGGRLFAVSRGYKREKLQKEEGWQYMGSYVVA